MRISDWSSDVCSSDLLGDAVLFQAKDFADFPIGLPLGNEYDAIALAVCEVNGTAARGTTPTADLPSGIERESSDQLSSKRSEEHTSELQSLMRISYAVLCLKKKKKITI